MYLDTGGNYAGQNHRRLAAHAAGYGEELLRKGQKNPRLVELNRSLEHKRVVSKARKGHRNSPKTEFKRDNLPFFKGKHLPEEVKAQLKQANEGKHFSPVTEFKKGLLPWNKGKSWNDIYGEDKVSEMKRQHSEMLTLLNKSRQGIPLDSETRRKLSKRIKELYENDPAYRERVSIGTKRAMSRDDVRKNFMDYITRRSEDPEWFKKVMSNRRPTDIEQVMISIIEKYRLPYRYTGNGIFKVNGKYPDFVNTNSKKIAIDIFGDYWHDAASIPEREATFAEWGWKLMIFWGHEVKSLSEEAIVEKIRGVK